MIGTLLPFIIYGQHLIDDIENESEIETETTYHHKNIDQDKDYGFTRQAPCDCYRQEPCDCYRQ